MSTHDEVEELYQEIISRLETTTALYDAYKESKKKEPLSPHSAYYPEHFNTSRSTETSLSSPPRAKYYSSSPSHGVPTAESQYGVLPHGQPSNSKGGEDRKVEASTPDTLLMLTDYYMKMCEGSKENQTIKSKLERVRRKIARAESFRPKAVAKLIDYIQNLATGITKSNPSEPNPTQDVIMVSPPNSPHRQYVTANHNMFPSAFSPINHDPHVAFIASTNKHLAHEPSPGQITPAHKGMALNDSRPSAAYSEKYGDRNRSGSFHYQQTPLDFSRKIDGKSVIPSGEEAEDLSFLSDTLSFLPQGIPAAYTTAKRHNSGDTFNTGGQRDNAYKVTKGLPGHSNEQRENLQEHSGGTTYPVDPINRPSKWNQHLTKPTGQVIRRKSENESRKNDGIIEHLKDKAQSYPGMFVTDGDSIFYVMKQEERAQLERQTSTEREVVLKVPINPSQILDKTSYGPASQTVKQAVTNQFEPAIDALDQLDSITISQQPISDQFDDNSIEPSQFENSYTTSLPAVTENKEKKANLYEGNVHSERPSHSEETKEQTTPFQGGTKSVESQPESIHRATAELERLDKQLRKASESLQKWQSSEQVAAPRKSSGISRVQSNEVVLAKSEGGTLLPALKHLKRTFMDMINVFKNESIKPQYQPSEQHSNDEVIPTNSNEVMTSSIWTPKIESRESYRKSHKSSNKLFKKPSFTSTQPNRSIMSRHQAKQDRKSETMESKSVVIVSPQPSDDMLPGSYSIAPSGQSIESKQSYTSAKSRQSQTTANSIEISIHPEQHDITEIVQEPNRNSDTPTQSESGNRLTLSLFSERPHDVLKFISGTVMGIIGSHIGSVRQADSLTQTEPNAPSSNSSVVLSQSVLATIESKNLMNAEISNFNHTIPSPSASHRNVPPANNDQGNVLQAGNIPSEGILIIEKEIMNTRDGSRVDISKELSNSRVNRRPGSEVSQYDGNPNSVQNITYNSRSHTSSQSIVSQQHSYSSVASSRMNNASDKPKASLKLSNRSSNYSMLPLYRSSQAQICLEDSLMESSLNRASSKYSVMKLNEVDSEKMSMCQIQNTIVPLKSISIVPLESISIVQLESISKNLDSSKDQLMRGSNDSTHTSRYLSCLSEASALRKGYTKESVVDLERASGISTERNLKITPKLPKYLPATTRSDGKESFMFISKDRHQLSGIHSLNGSRMAVHDKGSFSDSQSKQPSNQNLLNVAVSDMKRKSTTSLLMKGERASNMNGKLDTSTLSFRSMLPEPLDIESLGADDFKSISNADSKQRDVVSSPEPDDFKSILDNNIEDPMVNGDLPMESRISVLPLDDGYPSKDVRSMRMIESKWFPATRSQAPKKEKAHRQTLLNNTNRLSHQECLEQIFSYLDMNSLLKASQVNKQWYTVSHRPSLWKRLIVSETRIVTSHLSQISTWASLMSHLELRKIKGPRKPKSQSPGDYLRQVLGYLESGVKAILTSAGAHLRTVIILNCSNLISDNVFSMLSDLAPNLQVFKFTSIYHPPDRDSLWLLGRGCRGLTELDFTPTLKSSYQLRFNDECCLIIARSWPHLTRLTVGGEGITAAGLVSISRHCKDLVYLCVYRGPPITRGIVLAMCKYGGLRDTREVWLTGGTPVTREALSALRESCPHLLPSCYSSGLANSVEPSNPSKHEFVSLGQSSASVTMSRGSNNIVHRWPKWSLMMTQRSTAQPTPPLIEDELLNS